MCYRRELYCLTVPDRFNLTEYFVDRHIEEGRGEKAAVMCGTETLTYSAILERVQRAASCLRGLGVERGDRVVLLLPDSMDFIAVFLGAVRIGAVAVPCNTSLRAADYARILDEAQPKAIVAHDSLAHLVDGRVIVPEELLQTESADVEPALTSEEDAAFWLWTSGSTGAPKAAVHRHVDWIYCSQYYARGVLGIRDTDVTFSSSKLFHAYGLGNGLMFPFYAGATTILYNGKPQAKTILEIARDTRPTLLFSVPTLFAAMLQEPDSYDLSSVRLAISAAEPLPAEIFRRWQERFGFEILDGLGSTELLHIYISSRPGLVKPGSSGQPVEGYEIRITDENGVEVPRGVIGDLWVKGPSLASCYWNRPELTAEKMRNSWFFSGDKYYADNDGYFWYAGRSDDMFRVSGEWVSPFEVESALVAHPAVLEAAVVPYEDEHKLLKPKACVVLKDGWASEDDLARELQQFVRDRLAGYKYPRKIEFRSDLPKTPTGKIQRCQLRS